MKTFLARLRPRAPLLALSCVPSANASSPTAPQPQTTSYDVVAPEAGSEQDLRTRGAFRLEESYGAATGIDDPWLTMTVQTRAPNGQWWAVSAGGQLRSTEHLIVNIELHRPAHIYIIDIGASGVPNLLYPDQRYEPDTLLGAGRHRLPQAAAKYSVIELDHEIGQEYIFVVATRTPIDSADAGLARILEQLERRETPKLVTPSHRRTDSKPRARSTGKRPRARSQAEIDRALFSANAAAVPELSSRGGFRSRITGAAIDARAGDDPVVVIPFSFEHIPAIPPNPDQAQ